MRHRTLWALGLLRVAVFGIVAITTVSVFVAFVVTTGVMYSGGT
jgi:hypothetical protein